VRGCERGVLRAHARPPRKAVRMTAHARLFVRTMGVPPTTHASPRLTRTRKYPPLASAADASPTSSASITPALVEFARHVEDVAVSDKVSVAVTRWRHEPSPNTCSTGTSTGALAAALRTANDANNSKDDDIWVRARAVSRFCSRLKRWWKVETLCATSTPVYYYLRPPPRKPP
jgi:hypothetical protein